jgi:hypothetical protein
MIKIGSTYKFHSFEMEKWVHIKIEDIEPRDSGDELCTVEYMTGEHYGYTLLELEDMLKEMLLFEVPEDEWKVAQIK